MDYLEIWEGVIPELLLSGDKEKKPIGGEGEIFLCCPFKGLTLSDVCHHT
jgi:hypothetical protein